MKGKQLGEVLAVADFESSGMDVPPKMNFRFASWNVRNIGEGREGDGLLRLIEKQKPDLLALQEVNPKFHVKLATMGSFAWSACSLTLRRPSKGDASDRKRGCSIFGRSPFVLSWLRLLDDVGFPEQTLVANLHYPTGELVACSFHTPPGASHKDKKSRFLRAIAEWMAPRKSGTVFGIDANAPKTDHPNITQNEWWRDGERELTKSKLCCSFRNRTGLH